VQATWPGISHHSRGFYQIRGGRRGRVTGFRSVDGVSAPTRHSVGGRPHPSASRRRSAAVTSSRTLVPDPRFESHSHASWSRSQPSASVSMWSIDYPVAVAPSTVRCASRNTSLSSRCRSTRWLALTIPPGVADVHQHRGLVEPDVRLAGDAPSVTVRYRPEDSPVDTDFLSRSGRSQIGGWGRSSRGDVTVESGVAWSFVPNTDTENGGTGTV
jgi:hypothetical protein